MPPEEPESPAGGPGPPDGRARLRVTETLAAAARGAVGPEQVPGALCSACVRLLPVTGASVSISGGKGVRLTWCASDGTAARLAELQYTIGDGPCQSALDQGAPVLAADLTDGPAAGRWPIFAQEAVGLGVRAVFSLPLGVSGAAIGTLDLYSHRVGGLGESDLRIAAWVRDAVTYALMGLQTATPDLAAEATDDGVATWVAASEAEHTEVYQAVGMVMVQLDLDPEQALDLLRAHAYAESRTVSQVARDVLARRLRFHPEPEGAEGGGGADADASGWGGESAVDGVRDPDDGPQDPDDDRGDEGRDGAR
ncbi:GAF and ANTAR domain-containing protein [Streptomyces sp. NPDC001606]